jgi:hypothetical protein
MKTGSQTFTKYQLYAKQLLARHRWLMPVIQLLRRQRSGGMQFEASPGNSLEDPISKIPNTK